MKSALRYLQLFAIFSVLVIFSGMTDCGDSRKSKSSEDPKFIALKDGEGCFDAVITDELSRIEVSEVSFIGTTKVGGILYEDTDASGCLDVENLLGKTIKIVEENYSGIRHSGKNLFKAAIIDNANSTESKSLSSLKDVRILGIDKTTGKTLFKAKIVKGKDISVFKDAEFMGIDKKTGKTLFSAKVVEIADKSSKDNENVVRDEEKTDSDRRYILIPQDTVICGIDKKTGSNMSWLMRKIDSIEFKKPSTSESPEAKIDMQFKKAAHKVGSKK